jgi:hypothetical protein
MSNENNQSISSLQIKDELKHIHKTVIIFQPTILEKLEADKTDAIKSIMFMVDSHVSDTNSHKYIRKAVLDSINQMSRNFALVLERIVKQYGS